MLKLSIIHVLLWWPNGETHQCDIYAGYATPDTIFIFNYGTPAMICYSNIIYVTPACDICYISGDIYVL